MFSILSGTNSFIANVSTSNQLLKSNMSNSSNGNPSYNGNYVSRVCEQDAGIVLGTPTQKQSDVSSYYRKRVGKSCLIHYTKFGNSMASNIILPNTNEWYNLTSTYSIINQSSCLVFNTNKSVYVANSGCTFFSNKSFNLFNYGMEYTYETVFCYDSPSVQVGLIIMFGFGITVTKSSTNSDILNGIYFMYNQSSQLFGCITINQTTYMTDLMSIPTVGENHKYNIIINTYEVIFMINGNIVGSLPINTTIYNNMNSLTLMIRYYMVTYLTNYSLSSIYYVTVSVSDILTNKPWNHTVSMLGFHSSQYYDYLLQSADTSTKNTSAYTNSMVVGAGTTQSNTTGLTGLGGQVACLLQTSDTDAILTTFLVNVTTTTPNLRFNKNLVITGISIQGVVTTALSAVARVVYSVGYGSNTLSLATVDDNGITKGYRRIPLGVSIFSTTTVGTIGSRIDYTFNPPIILNTNEYFTTIYRPSAITGVITHLVSVNGYWD